MGYQLAAACTCAVWSFTVSIILLFIINKIPGCHIRATEDDELRGLDFKYFHDVDEEDGMMVLNGFGATTPGITRSDVTSPRAGGSQDGIVVPVMSEKRD